MRLPSLPAISAPASSSLSVAPRPLIFRVAAAVFMAGTTFLTPSAALLAALPTASPASIGQTLDLKAAVRLAESQSPTLQQSRLALETSRLEETNASVAWLPSLDLNSSATVSNSASSPNSRTLGLTVTENLYDNHESITTWKVARLRREVAEQTYALQREQLALEVAQDFFRLSQLQHLLEVRREQNRLVIEQFKLLDLQYRQGLKTREDFLRIRSQRMRSELDLVNLENQIRQSRLNLLRLCGEAPDTSHLEFSIIEPEKEPLPTIPSESPRVRERFPTFLAFNARTQALEIQQTQADRRFWPNLSLRGSVAYDNTAPWSSSTSFANSGAWNSSATLALTWNLVDWGLRSRNQAIAERNLLLENAKIRQETLALSNDAARLQIEIGRLQALFKVNSELVRSESESYTALNENYRRGQIRFLDLITGLRDFADARAQWLSVYFQLRSALVQHAFYEARLYETFNR